ncbi:MAG: hypothetical protein QOG72_1067 [Sphingomonadales bacterium]|nr:hypothetical protein [Sphingomonadales bacterium]
MAEWLRRGLQILARRFDSGSGLHPWAKNHNAHPIFFCELKGWNLPHGHVNRLPNTTKSRELVLCLSKSS